MADVHVENCVEVFQDSLHTGVKSKFREVPLYQKYTYGGCQTGNNYISDCGTHTAVTQVIQQLGSTEQHDRHIMGRIDGIFFYMHYIATSGRWQSETLLAYGDIWRNRQ